jgi:threonine/homoserine/homoserine lactone efflux protein
MLRVDYAAGMPLAATFGEGPPVILFRAAILWLTDAPIIVGALVLATKAAELRPLLGIVSSAGGVFVLYLAWDSLGPAHLSGEAPAEPPQIVVRRNLH